MDIITAQQNLIAAQQDYINALMQGNILPQTIPQNSIQYGLAPEPKEINSIYPTFEEIVEEFLDYEKPLIREASYQSYKYLLKSSLLDAFGKTPINEISSKMMQDHINELNIRGFAVKSMRERIGLLKNILHYAERKEIIVPKKYHVRYPNAPKEKYKVFTEDEYKKLYNYCLEDKHPMSTGILLAMETGMRIGEVCGMQWKDVDLENKVLSINKSVQRVYLMDERTSKVIINPPKTQTSKRQIPITNKFSEILLNKKPIGISEDHFIASSTGNPNEPRVLRQGYDRRIKKIGLPKMTFHGLRHTFATRAIAKGVDVKTVSAILGHSTCDITLNIYTTCTDEMMSKAMETLESD